MPEGLRVPPLPSEAAHVWEYWAELNSTRAQGANGPSPISFLDLQTWQSIRGVALDKWEVRAILRIDAEFMQASHRALTAK